MVFTAYKQVNKKIHPFSMQLPLDCKVTQKIPEAPLLTLSPLTNQPPDFVPTTKITQEWIKELNVNATGFLWPEDEKLFQHIMWLNEHAIAFEDVEWGMLKESYFFPYIIPTIPHSPWEYKNIPIPPSGLLPKVLDVLNLKIGVEVYEQSQSSYCSCWFVVLKKSDKLHIVHDLQPLNKVTIRDAGQFWNSAGELVNPVGSEVIWSSPSGVINAIQIIIKKFGDTILADVETFFIWIANGQNIWSVFCWFGYSMGIGIVTSQSIWWRNGSHCDIVVGINVLWNYIFFWLTDQVLL